MGRVCERVQRHETQSGPPDEQGGSEVVAAIAPPLTLAKLQTNSTHKKVQASAILSPGIRPEHD